jgi:benzoyl-CoA reductase/2-hydroxyglutaryl-CoA dehydratase subunit BcrC/BadD/HgdB
MGTSEIISKLRVLKQTGKPIIACFPLYPPLELLHAMGLAPIVLWGLKGLYHQTPESDKHLQPYVCSVARHLTEFLLTEGGDMIDGIWMYNACDTLRNLPEIFVREFSASGRKLPVIRMHIPMTPRQQTDSITYFENELRSVISLIQTHFGVLLSTDAFKSSLAIYNRLKTLALEAEQRVATKHLRILDFSRVMQEGWLSPVENHLAALESLMDTCKDQPGNARKNGGKTGVIISGILPPPESIISAIESSGLVVVGNDIASLRRSYGDIYDAPADPIGYYHQLYSDHYPCPTLLYRGDCRFEKLMKQIDQTDARGVVFVGEKFCEYEYFEYPYLEKRLRERGIYSLMIEIAMEDEFHTSAHLARIEAFAEMVHTMPHLKSL